MARLAIGHVWSWHDVEAWATETGHGRWDRLPAGLVGEELVPLQAWAKEHDVLPADLIELGREGLLPLASRGRRWYIDPEMAAAVWAEHGDRMVAKHLVVPRGRRRP